jgi:hypothetical protein
MVWECALLFATPSPGRLPFHPKIWNLKGRIYVSDI